MSKLTNEMARHMREIHFGNNWSDSAMQEILKDITWTQALETPIPNVNSIAVLVFHMNFYLDYVHRNLKNDIFIFDHEDSFKAPTIQSEADWQALLQKTWDDAEAFAQTIEKIPDAQMYKVIPPRTNIFYKNIHGVIEHNHYHLGQIVLLKKLV
jgi:uncharacterized damage-inducible protein DinB